MEILEMKIEDIRVSDVGKLVSIEGNVRKVGTQYPFCEESYYICSNCGEEIYLKHTLNTSNIPIFCRNEICMKKDKYQLIEDKCTWIDVQEFYLYDKTKFIKVFVKGEQVGVVKDDHDYCIVGTILILKTGKDKHEYAIYAIDVDQMLTPSNNTRTDIKIVRECIKEIANRSPENKALFADVYAMAKINGVSIFDCKRHITEMIKIGDLYIVDNTHIKMTP